MEFRLAHCRPPLLFATHCHSDCPSRPYYISCDYDIDSLVSRSGSYWDRFSHDAIGTRSRSDEQLFHKTDDRTKGQTLFTFTADLGIRYMHRGGHTSDLRYWLEPLPQLSCRSAECCTGRLMSYHCVYTVVKGTNDIPDVARIGPGWRHPAG